MALRSASLSQFLRPSANGSYAFVDAEMLVGIKGNCASQQQPTPSMLEHFTVDDEGTFEYIANMLLSK